MLLVSVVLFHFRVHNRITFMNVTENSHVADKHYTFTFKLCFMPSLHLLYRCEFLELYYRTIAF